MADSPNLSIELVRLNRMGLPAKLVLPQDADRRRANDRFN